jgi:predicted amidophosphoribosyltransferase
VAWCASCALRSVVLGERVCLDCQGGESRRLCLRRDHLRLLAAVQFGRESGALVRATKYEACPERLSAWRDAWAASEPVGLGAVDLLVPVPAHGTRVRERGFDVTGHWTRTLAALHGMPWAHALMRSRATPPQAGADRSRRLANVRGAFAPGPEAGAVAGRRVALVDDVVTTGATVRAAASVLETLGARQIEIWAFAFDPLE